MPNDWCRSHDNSSDDVLKKDFESNPSEEKTLEARREILMKKLQTNFPIITAILFGSAFLIIGLAAISLQIVLIVNTAYNYGICNGIWGGFFALLNGSMKFNMGNLLQLMI